MATLATISDIARHAGSDVSLHGWVYNKTRRGKLIFVQLRDGTGVIQAVVKKQNVQTPQAMMQLKRVQWLAAFKTATLPAQPAAEICWLAEPAP